MAMFEFQEVTDLLGWRYQAEHADTTREFDQADLTAEPWPFLSAASAGVFAALENRHAKKLDMVADIFVGVQTSANDIYVIVGEEDGGVVNFTDNRGNRRSIERAILRPCLHKKTIQPFSTIHPNCYILFPYRIDGGRAVLYSSGEMERGFPLAWAYLQTYQTKLAKRDLGASGNPEAEWYRYGRHQSLTKFEDPKLIVQVMALIARYGYDPDGVVVTGGGNGGPYYLIRPKHDSAMSIFFIQALLHHPVIEAMVKTRARTFQGSYYSHNQQSLKDLPIPDLQGPELRAAHDTIVAEVQRLIDLTNRLSAAHLPGERDTIEGACHAVNASIAARVSILYGLSDDEFTAMGEQ